MIDLWAEKPKPAGETSVAISYWNDELDIWLEKLKVEHDLLKEHSGRWLHFVAVDYPEIKESLSPKELMELKDKAEKLEAVKTWLIRAKAEGRVSMSVGFSLGLVLGVEE